MLDRVLDRILSDDERKHTLRLPPPEKYRFAVDDSDDNIIYDKDNGNHFVIKVNITLMYCFGQTLQPLHMSFMILVFN